MVQWSLEPVLQWVKRKVTIWLTVQISDRYKIIGDHNCNFASSVTQNGHFRPKFCIFRRKFSDQQIIFDSKWGEGIYPSTLRPRHNAPAYSDPQPPGRITPEKRWVFGKKHKKEKQNRERKKGRGIKTETQCKGLSGDINSVGRKWHNVIIFNFIEMSDRFSYFLLSKPGDNL